MAPELLKPPDEARGPVLSTKTDVYAFAMTCLEVSTRLLDPFLCKWLTFPSSDLLWNIPLPDR